MLRLKQARMKWVGSFLFAPRPILPVFLHPQICTFRSFEIAYFNQYKMTAQVEDWMDFCLNVVKTISVIKPII